MQKLSELFGKICSASERGKKGVLVDLQTISEIRDELWALEQRAEAAEALNNHLELAVRKTEGVSESLRRRVEDAENKLLFTRPAADLSELVPDKWSLEQALKFVEDYTPPSEEESVLFAVNSFRAAILRNIEEAK